MAIFTVAQKGKRTVICVERLERGITRVAAKLAADLIALTGRQQANTRNIRVIGTCDPYSGAARNADVVIAAGVIGGGSWIDEAARLGLIDCAPIQGKRECYVIKTLTLEDGRSAVIVAGSDRLGAEYGLYEISAACGVSPWHYWADVRPIERGAAQCGKEKLNTVSHEPEIKLRGFFLNDEWPSLGGWVTETFGGFNERFYDTVFDLLLRLRGNFLWPAMWTGVFSEDGEAFPTASAELADEYGIVMGTSHHEPLFRAGEEFSHTMTDDNAVGYGKDWNYFTNTRGLYDFWKYSVERNRSFRSLITVGMRGERDSKVLGENATLGDNIDLIKKTIIDQKRILAENGLADAPKVLALYKEVEDYYYGDEHYEGLASWEELDDVMLLLSDDNFGNTRTLPTPLTRDRKAGWGLYYHFDYHGGPISYEWVNSSTLEKTWEQLTTAYSFGVRELWVANVGDLRPDELPLSYFMALASNYEKWSGANKTDEWLNEWVEQQFGGSVSTKTCGEIAALLEDYTRFNSDRRPESTHPDTFSFAEEDEYKRELDRLQRLESAAECISEDIPEERRDAFYGLVEFPARASANLRRMMILSGMQQLYYSYASSYANELADSIEYTISADKELCRRYNEDMSGGKWNRMMSSKHVDFVKWNDEGSAYPSPKRLLLSEHGELMAMLPGGGAIMSGRLNMPLFSDTEKKTHSFILTSIAANLPPMSLSASAEWIRYHKQQIGSGTVEYIVSVDYDRLGSGWGSAKGSIDISSDGRRIAIAIEAVEASGTEADKGVYIESTGVVSIEAEHYFAKHDTPEGQWLCIEGYGKSLSSMKVLPADTFIENVQSAPYLEYRFYINNADDYTLTAVIAPTNNPFKDKGQRFAIQLDGGEPVIKDSLPEGYAAGSTDDENWCGYVLDACRRCDMKLSLCEGEHTLRFIHIDAGIVLQKLEIAKKPSKAYYGYRETYRR